MYWPSKCAVVIPCSNEASAISSLVENVRRQLPYVIVVDDGSADGTAAIATHAGAEVLRHDRARGKGAALMTGWKRAAERGFSWALAMDGDGQHHPQDIAAFLSVAGKGDADLVVGDRLSDATGMPWLRRQVNRWMSRRISRLAGRNLSDSQCGFRLMRLAAWSTLQLQTRHFEIESEVLLSFVASGYAVKFVPIRVIYQAEQSKIRPFQDAVRWFHWWRRASAMTQAVQQRQDRLRA